MTGTFGSSNSSGSGSPTSSVPKGHSNPYARPLSAKDIVGDYQVQQKIKKTPSGTQLQPSQTGMYNNGAAGTPMFGFPVNAFMRPQSALRKDQNVKSNVVERAKVAAKEIGAKNGITKTTPRKLIPPTKLEREQDLSEIGVTSSDTPGTHTIKKTFGPAKVDTGPSSGVSKSQSRENVTHETKASQSKATVGSQTQNSLIGKTSGKPLAGAESENGGQTKTIAYAKPVSSLPRPGSAIAGSQKVVESATKVRNLNYTPTKPYHEVSNPAQADKPVLSATTKTQQTQETVITVKNDIPKGTTYMAPSNIAKPTEPKYSGSVYSNGAKQANTGTAYYRKESKADIMIHEQRPPAVGAPSKPPRGAEKNLSTNLTSGSEFEEAADDESEIPSG